MLVFFTQRRLKPGAFQEFREAWEPDDMPEGIREVAYHARSVQDPDEVISFGLAYDMDVEDLEALREQFAGDDERQARMARFVEWTGLDGVFEVVDEVRWGM